MSGGPERSWVDLYCNKERGRFRSVLSPERRKKVDEDIETFGFTAHTIEEEKIVTAMLMSMQFVKSPRVCALFRL